MSTKILLIDDEQEITSLLSRVLNKYGFDAITANSSVEGIQSVRENGPDTVILDLMMPDLNGKQVCAEIRKFSSVPIIIFSAFSEPDMIESVLDAGANFFLSKPASIPTLISHIKNAVQYAC
jgi:DNA-binding response OmpR family regulator